MKRKTKKILQWLPTVPVSLFITSTALMKVTGYPQLAAQFAAYNLSGIIKPLGIIEFVFLLLFLWNRTVKIGLLLLTALYGGAAAIELGHKGPILFPLVLLAAIWIAAACRSKYHFAPQPAQTLQLS